MSNSDAIRMHISRARSRANSTAHHATWKHDSGDQRRTREAGRGAREHATRHATWTFARDARLRAAEADVPPLCAGVEELSRAPDEVEIAHDRLGYVRLAARGQAHLRRGRRGEGGEGGTARRRPERAGRGGLR